MTRAGGTTPRGFPYPGASGIQANTPGALQALAEAITAQLGTVAGVVTDTFIGSRSVTSNTPPPWTVADFPKLSAITGLVVTMYGNPPSRMVQGGAVPTQPGALGTPRLVPMRNREPVFTGSVTVYALAWGPPK